MVQGTLASIITKIKKDSPCEFTLVLKVFPFEVKELLKQKSANAGTSLLVLVIQNAGSSCLALPLQLSDSCDYTQDRNTAPKLSTATGREVVVMWRSVSSL